MSRNLTTTVALVDPDGSVHRFGPGDDVPAEYAARITNPAVWDDGKGGAATASPATPPAPAEGHDEDTETSADGPRKGGRRHS